MSEMHSVPFSEMKQRLLLPCTQPIYIYIQSPALHNFVRSELDICTRITNARILNIDTLAALLIPHPLDLDRLTSLLQLSQCTKEDPDRVTAADRVARPMDIFGEATVSLGGFRGRECQYFHCFVVQDRNRLVNRVISGGRWTSTGKTDGSSDVGRWLWIVEGVRESCSPVTKIARDDAKRVLPRKERRNKFPESNFLLLIYCTDEDGNNGYIQHKVDAFQCCAHLRQSVYPYR